MTKRKAKNESVPRIEAHTPEEKIFVLEYALKVAVTMRDDEFKMMRRRYDAADNENFRLRREIEALRKHLHDFLPFTAGDPQF